MPTPDVTAGDVMELAAALLNDMQRQIYNDVNMLPYLKIALRNLRELLELNNIPVVHKTSTVLTVPSGTTSIGFTGTPSLPSDLASIIQLWETDTIDRGYTPVTKKSFIPNSLTTPVGMFQIWTWKGNAIVVPSAAGDIYLKIDYIAQLFGTVVDANSNLNIINGESYLHYKTAALCAFYIGENKTRSDELNGEAELAFDRASGIETKAKQAIGTRRKPFRSGYKTRAI